MKFSVIHPTARVTPDFESPWWLACISAARGCDRPEDCEYIVVVHVSRRDAFWGLMRGGLIGEAVATWGQFRVVTNYGRDCLVDQGNAGLVASSGEINIGNQDDMRYPQHWDSEVSKLIPDTSKLVCVQAWTDGSRRDLLTIPTIATRALCRAIGLTSPEYDGMFTDNEWSIRARQYGTVVQSSLYFEHLHFTLGKSQIDSVYSAENRPEAYDIGRKVFEQRRAAGFPRVPFPDEGQQIRHSPLQAVSKAFDWAKQQFATPPVAPVMPPLRRFVACLPGPDHERLATLFNLQGYLSSRGYNFSAVLGYTSSPDVTRIELSKTALEDCRDHRDVPYILWLDDDNVLEPAQLGRMMDFLDAELQADIVVGWCWIRKGVLWSTSVGTFREDMHVDWMTLGDLARSDRGGAPFRVDGLASGFPCVLMRREVLEHLGAEAFQRIPGDFPYGSLGEDFSFFWRAHKAGMNCYVDPSCKVGHLKMQNQEPTLAIPAGATVPPIVKEWQERVNGKPVEVPTM